MHIFLAFLVPYMILLQPVPVPAKNPYILNEKYLLGFLYYLFMHLQFFRHAPLFNHLFHQHLNFFSCFFIDLIQLLRQFPGQYQILIPGTPVFLQKLFSHYSIFPICRFFLIDFQIWQIIISMQCIAQSVLFIINLFLHILTTPFLCTLLYSS